MTIFHKFHSFASVFSHNAALTPLTFALVLQLQLNIENLTNCQLTIVLSLPHTSHSPPHAINFRLAVVTSVVNMGERLISVTLKMTVDNN